MIAHTEVFILNTHFSLHFDGPMVNGEGVDTDSGINDMLQYLVHKATGIRIQLEEKENLTWLEFVMSQCGQLQETVKFEEDDALFGLRMHWG